jgi:diguanylate cyclase (GGDEF)-like protein
VNWGAWIPGILGPTAISVGWLLASALQTENIKNQLLVRFAQERVSQAAQGLSAETKDYAIWDETFAFLKGSNPDYIARNFNSYTFGRIPMIVFFDGAGSLVSAYQYNTDRRRIEPLPAAAKRDILELIPSEFISPSQMFMGRVAGKPYLVALQSVLPTNANGPSSGGLLFVRAVDHFQSFTLNEAIGIISETFLPPQPINHSLLGPIEIEIKHPQLVGRQTLQHVVTRRPVERIQALQTILLVLGFDLLLLGVIAFRSYLIRRRHRKIDLERIRNQRRLSRDLSQREATDSLTGLLSELGLIRSIKGQGLNFPDFIQLAIHLNLDNFSFVMGSMGRSGGDMALIGVANELRRFVHSSSLVARISADEFICCIIGTSDAALLSELSQLALTINQLKITVEGHSPISIRASLGASFVDPDDPVKALHEASVACRITRMGGGASYQLYGESQGATTTYLAIQHSNEELLAAIRDNRIRLYAQHAWSLVDADRFPSVYVELLARIEDVSDGHCYWSESLIEAAAFCGTLKLLDIHVLDIAIAAISNIVKASPAGSQNLVYVFHDNLVEGSRRSG